MSQNKFSLSQTTKIRKEFEYVALGNVTQLWNKK